MVVAKNPVSSGSKQTITVTVFSKNSNEKIVGTNIEGTINYDSGKTKKFVGITDSSGGFSYSWKIDKNSDLGVVNISVQASKFGYYPVVKIVQFVVIAHQNNNDVSRISNSNKNIYELNHSKNLNLPVSHKDHSGNSIDNTKPTSQGNNDKIINNFNHEDNIFGINNIKKSVHGITHKDHSGNSIDNTKPTSQGNNDKIINNFNHEDNIFGINNIKKSVHGITHKDHSGNSIDNTKPTSQGNNDKIINNFNHEDNIFGINNIKKSVHGMTQNILDNIQHNLNNQGIHVSIPFN